MGLFSKIKDKIEGKDQEYSHLQGQNSAAGSQQLSNSEDYSHLSSDNKGQKKKQDYVEGPPGYSQYGPPTGPPPGPPPVGQPYYPPPPSGFPPAFSEAGASSSGAPSYGAFDYAPGPPPGYMVFDDSPGAPPPPALPVRSQYSSQGLNASEDDADAGHNYCTRHPVNPPVAFPPDAVNRLRRGEVGLSYPTSFRGQVTQLDATSYSVRTPKGTPDTTLLSCLPLFSAINDFPREKGFKTIYYQIKIISLSTRRNEETSIAIGYSNVPIPPFRLPGWHRGGMAVHSDDGNRFTNDPYGGRLFTGPFRQGQTIGLGMRFRLGQTEAFLTRDGHEDGKWFVDEEIDSEDSRRLNMGRNAKGLLGDNDLYAAIGVFGAAEFEVSFGYNEWQDSGIQD